jgi:hypothetical protein
VRNSLGIGRENNVIENDIQKLDELRPDGRLDGLEADIWGGVAARMEAQRVSRLVLTCQMLTIALALAISIVTVNSHGQSAAQNFEAKADFTNGMNLAPSTLLLGS